MEIWKYIKSSVCNFHTFDNYFNDQPAVELLKNNYRNNYFDASQTIISASPGNGVTHLIHAICNEWVDKGKNILYITGQSIVYILKKIKSQIDLNKFQSHLLSFEMLAIDNIQFFYKKSVHFSQFALSLINKCKGMNKPLFLGCSQPDRDFTKSKKHSKIISLQRIELKPLSSINVFEAFKNLCEHERLISENLMYVI